MPEIKRNTYPTTNPYDPKFASLDISADQFNALLREYGVRVLHEKAVPCPNYKGNPDTGNHQLDCSVCKGSGFIYYVGYEYTALFQSNSLQRMFQMQGFLDPGTATLTIPSQLEDKTTNIYVAYFDRFTLIDFEDRYSELIMRDRSSDVDLLRYKALKVEYLKTSTNEYYEGKDFIIDDNGNIKWLGINRPGDNIVPAYGDVYTISYLYRPVYRVIHILHEGRFVQRKLKLPAATPTRFPQQLILKKDFLLAKTDSQTGEPIKPPIVP